MFLYNIESIAKKLQIDYEDITSILSIWVSVALAGKMFYGNELKNCCHKNLLSEMVSLLIVKENKAVNKTFSFMMLLIHLHFYKRSPLVLFLWKVYMQP